MGVQSCTHEFGCKALRARLVAYRRVAGVVAKATKRSQLREGQRRRAALGAQGARKSTLYTTLWHTSYCSKRLILRGVTSCASWQQAGVRGGKEGNALGGELNMKWAREDKARNMEQGGLAGGSQSPRLCS